jgi:RND family efflux transporter MFP subunit
MKRLPLPLLALLVTGCSSEPPEAPLPPPPKVTVAQPIRRTLVDLAEATGRTEAPETYEVRVRVKGFLKAVKFKEGAPVKKGDLLYDIDPRTFEADLESAQAEVARLDAVFKMARSEADRAHRTRLSSAISEEEYMQKFAAQETAQAALRKGKAAIETARLELSFTKIFSPIDGVIGRTLVTEGNLVGYNDPTLLTTVVRTDPIYVYFDVTERAILEHDELVRKHGAPALQAKVPAHIGLATDKGHPHQGYIDFRDNKVDPGTGTIRLRAVLENKSRVLTPGLFCRVQVPIGLATERLLVPESALGLDQRGRFVLVADAEGTVEARTVRTGMATDDGYIVIADGLKGDEWVIVNGLQRARPGSKVAPPAAATGK